MCPDQKSTSDLLICRIMPCQLSHTSQGDLVELLSGQGMRGLGAWVKESSRLGFPSQRCHWVRSFIFLHIPFRICKTGRMTFLAVVAKQMKCLSSIWHSVCSINGWCNYSYHSSLASKCSNISWCQKCSELFFNQCQSNPTNLSWELFLPGTGLKLQVWRGQK